MKEAQSKRGKTGGVASGTARRGKVWRNTALDLAKAIRAAQSTLSQLDLAQEIAFQWKLEEPCRTSMLIPLIREWERQGMLARRCK